MRMVFDSLDPHGTGVVTVQEMLERYDVSQNPDVKVCVIYIHMYVYTLILIEYILCSMRSSNYQLSDIDHVLRG